MVNNKTSKLLGDILTWLIIKPVSGYSILLVGTDKVRSMWAVGTLYSIGTVICWYGTVVFTVVNSKYVYYEQRTTTRISDIQI